MLEMVFLEDCIYYTFMYRNKHFDGEIAAENLGGEGKHVETFYEFKDNLDDPDRFHEFEELVVNPIYGLLDYYTAETFDFTLVNRNGVLEGIKPNHNLSHRNTRPRSGLWTRILAMVLPSVMGKPEKYRSANWGFRTRGQTRSNPTPATPITPPVPSFQASQLVRAAAVDSLEEEMCEVPRMVRDVNNGNGYFIKAAYDTASFQRELDMLVKTRELNLRTSRLAGLVYYDDQVTALLGMLIEPIEGQTLTIASMSAPASDRKRWAHQIEGTVRVLHGHGLVWGDAKPDNVMVGSSGDAIVVDFGGGFCPDYIDAELINTKDSDLQALKKVMEELLEEGGGRQ